MLPQNNIQRKITQREIKTQILKFTPFNVTEYSIPAKF